MAETKVYESYDYVYVLPDVGICCEGPFIEVPSDADSVYVNACWTMSDIKRRQYEHLSDILLAPLPNNPYDPLMKLRMRTIPRAYKLSSRPRRAARSVRSAVRPSFAAKKAAKADSGGSDGSDPEPRHRQNHPAVTLRIPAVSAFRFGGAK